MTEEEAKRFYNSNAWKNPKWGKRIEILRRDRFECQDCIARLKDARRKGIKLSGEDRLIRKAEQVHHIKELKDFPTLALDNDNLISLCIECHNIRHDRYVKRFVKKKKQINEEKW